MSDPHSFRGHWKAAFAGDYIAAVEFDGTTPTYTIRDASQIPLEVRKLGKDDREGADTKIKDKLVLFFDERREGWVMNRTNATCLAAMFGDVVAGWVGRRVTLCAELVQVGPKKEPGIRVVGSPDLDRPIRAKIELPRRKPIFRELVNTGRRPPPKPPQDALQAALRAGGCATKADAVAVLAYVYQDAGLTDVPDDPPWRAEAASAVVQANEGRPPGLLLADARAWQESAAGDDGVRGGK